MKLELKHLAPYLPYQLKIINIEMHENGFKNKNSIKELVLTPSNLEIGLKDIDGIKEKLILRPISDLYKEISFGMLKTIPLDNINFLYHNTPNFYFLTTDKSQEHLFDGKHDLSNTIIEYCVMQKLIEWHFDVFGLIDKSLAISIHDVKQVIA